MTVSRRSRIGWIIIASLVAVSSGLMGAYAHALWSSQGFSLTRSLNILFDLGIDRTWVANILDPRRRVTEKALQSARNSPELECLTESDVALFRTKIARVDDLFLNCRAELVESLGIGFHALSDTDLKVIFATILAHDMAPYGHSSTLEFDKLLSEPQLECDNYAALAGHISALMGILRKHSARFFVVGFDGGAVGNHAQIFYVRDGVNLLLDPTIGLVAVASFDAVLSGHVISEEKIADFYKWKDPPLERFRRKVWASLITGAYRPSDLLYFYESFDHFMGKLIHPKSAYRTPGGMSLRARGP